jgi:hypothetical protein
MAGTHIAAIAVAAARLIVEEGLEYGAAKRRAARDLGLQGRNGELPGNDEVEDEVRSYLDLFHADTQPAELAELRRIAAVWMERLGQFRPHLTGAVWRGTATRLSSIAIALIDMRIDYDVSSGHGPRGRVLDVLNVQAPSPALGTSVHLALTVRDYDDLRGALHRDGRGRSERGDLAALRSLETGN